MVTKAADRQRLYTAVERLCIMAGTDTPETVEWLCGPMGGMSRLFESYFSPKTQSQSFPKSILVTRMQSASVNTGKHVLIVARHT